MLKFWNRENHLQPWIVKMKKEMGAVHHENEKLRKNLDEMDVKYNEMLALCEADMKKVVLEEKERLKTEYKQVISSLKSVIDDKEIVTPLLIRAAETKENLVLIAEYQKGGIIGLQHEYVFIYPKVD